MIIKTQIISDNSMEFIAPITQSKNCSTLKEQLMTIEGVSIVDIALEKILVSKSNSISWDIIKPQVLAEISDYLSSNTSTEDDIEERIVGLINARIRPAIKQDGGDIDFKKFEDGVVYVELKGNCVGCAYAMVTLKEGVEKLLKFYIPEVKEVKNFDKESC